MANKNGLLAPTATHGALAPSYYALINGGTLVAPTLVSAIDLESADRTAAAQLSVVGLEGNPPALTVYSGSIGLRPGTSSIGAAPAGVNIRSIANGVAVEVGTDGAGIVNTLGVAGADGVAQVYDEIYNQPVQLQTITIVASDPDCTPTGGAEVFRCTQTAVAQAGAGTVQFNRIQVPVTGAYMMQSEVRMGNGAGPNTVVLPSAIVGGIPIWNSIALGMQEFSTVISVPYSSVEVIGGDFAAIDTFESSSLTIKTYSQVVFLDSTKVYAVTLATNSSAWNIGNSGQIKIELIAMC